MIMGMTMTMTMTMFCLVSCILYRRNGGRLDIPLLDVALHTRIEMERDLCSTCTMLGVSPELFMYRALTVSDFPALW